MRFPFRQRLLLIIFAIAAFINPVNAQAVSQFARDTRLEKLTAVAKTYGYVRFFHPSDQASLVDWDAMAFYVAEQTLASPNDESVAELLQRVWGPLVDGLQIYEGPEKPRPELRDAPLDEILAWQHVGVGLGAGNPLYSSVRTGRKNKIDLPADPFGNVLQSIDPAKILAHQIRMRFQAKIVEGNCKLQGWMRVDRDSGEVGFFNNMGDRPVTGKEWREYEITGTVDDDAAGLTFGVMFMGSGSALIDNLVLEHKVNEKWDKIEVGNADFETGKTRPAKWVTRGKGYSFKIETQDVAEGEQAMRFGRASIERGELMEVVPRLGEVIDVQIANNLRVRMPLALPVNRTYSPGDLDATEKLLQAIQRIDLNDVEQETLCIANVMIAWNVFQHFYPYFEQVDTDWEAALQTSLAKALKADSRTATTETLQWLVAQLHDGHGNVFHQLDFQNNAFLPVLFDWIENQLVVVASSDQQLQIGDILTHIDGVVAANYLAEKEELLSGSPQWKRYRSVANLTGGEKGESLEIKVNRQGETHAAVLKFTESSPLKLKKRPVIDLLVDGETDDKDIYYVDLGRAEPGDVRKKLEKFAAAKGIVFDLRGYPRGTQFLLQHMTNQHMQSQKWQVPKQIRPDRVDIREIETMGRWEMPPQEPRFQGKMVFLTDESAISYAESVMSIVANYKLGEIIGLPTAGANGNVNPFQLPGGYGVSWTGMRVMNHDDSQHHVRGVQPTISLEPTIEAVIEGRDEYVEKALELIKQE